jgi:hypothetical protein
MTGRILFLATSLALLGGCGPRDATITHGADGAPEWSRHLASAVPVGITADSARAIMTRNGFTCRSGSDTVAHLWCEKQSGGRVAIVRRRWQAALNLDERQRVVAVRGSTGLIGP